VRTTSPDSRVRVWLGIFRRRPVVVSSPHPVSECLERLEKVTTLRGPTTWYLDSRTVGRPEPRFRGQVYRSQIRLARFTAAAGRNSFCAMLDVRSGAGADGGTVLSGRIGLSDGGQVVLPAFTAAVGLAGLGFLVAGVAQLVGGRLIGLAPALAFPLPMAAWAGVIVLGRRALERDICELLKSVNEVLDSTAAFPHDELWRNV
jgi:hypothetical protein